MKSDSLQLNQQRTRGLLEPLHSLQESLHDWQRRARERERLSQLDAWTKRDLGLSDDDVAREANKPRWQA
jgi:uncharacterized protein YjiS (DUF1127 family)